MPAPSSGLTQSLLGNASNIVAYAHGRVDVVDSFIGQLSNSVLSLQAPSITPEFPTGGIVPAILVAETPTFEVPVWVSPAIPDAFTETLDVSDLELPAFTAALPDIQYGTAPAAFTGNVPDAPATNFNFDDPTLTVTLPDAPNLLTLNISNFAGVNMPTFTADAPELTAVAPTIREWTPEDAYTSTLLTALKSTLEDRILNGGTGLGDAESAIWERGREREARSSADAVAKLDEMEALGYMLPPGAYVDARLKIITETDYAERGASREVMIKSAELQLDNVKHALSTAQLVEGMLLQHTNSVEQRLFDATRYATEAGISLYNAKVQAFSAAIEVYRARAQVYEAQVRAEQGKVDAYRAQIAAEEAKASINRALVDQYRVQVDVALSAIKIFEAQIAAIQTKADIEKTKVMIFGEQVKGYVAQINAYTAGVEGYKATLTAEQTKQQVYTAQVQAFGARVEAAAKQIDARVASYRARLEAKTAEFDGYKATVQGEAARVQALAQSSGVVADAYKATVASVSSYNEVLTKQWQAVLEQSQRTAEIAVNAAKANAELYVTTRSLGLDAAKTGAQVAAQVGAAAINAVNFSGSVSSSEGYSANESVSFANSTSSSNSTSTNTNYTYSASV